MADLRFTDREMNCILYRYFEESGFKHTLFNFGYEVGLAENLSDCNVVPSGTLIKLVLKGIQLRELEANRKAGASEDFIYLEPWDLMTKGDDELQKIVEYKINPEKARENELNKENAGPSCLVKDAEETDNKSRRGQMPPPQNRPPRPQYGGAAKDSKAGKKQGKKSYGLGKNPFVSS